MLLKNIEVGNFDGCFWCLFFIFVWNMCLGGCLGCDDVVFE